MKPLYSLFILLIFLVSCKSSKQTTVFTKKKDLPKTTVSINTADAVVNNAKDYNGVKYQYGGTTRRGMDCSGLIYVSFKKEDIHLPRISRDMAKKGKDIHLNKVTKGDLLFFKTNKSRNVINHVGLVTKSNKGAIQFIHATSSKGVITSSLDEKYWNKAFVKAKRIL